MPDHPLPEHGQDHGDRELSAVLPRGLLILLGLAAAVITLGGMRQVASILAPLFLALVLTITVYPLRARLQRLGAPRWLATLAVVLGVYAVIIGLAVAFVLSVARLATVLPDYAPQMQSTIDGITAWLDGWGIGRDQITAALQGIDPAAVLALVGSLLNSFAGVASTLVFVITLVLFMGIDGAAYTTRADRITGPRRRALGALAAFAVGTRRYFVVSTIFGAIVAACDWVALVLLGVPASLLWALLAFVTNYVPNIGFIIGVIPPALLALLAGGVGQMIAVIVVYCLLNFVIQSVLQPKYVGDAVGLTTTVSFLSLIVWSYILGPLGAILAVPATLLAKAVLVDVDPDARWLQLFLGDEPDLSPKPHRRRTLRRQENQSVPNGTSAAAPPG